MTTSDFGAFFQALHAQTPFPWQERLVQTVLTTGWPATLSLPAAGGKTAIPAMALALIDNAWYCVA
jgi:CRISPR-associated endonuclease/helicase Cas3